jgi:ribosome recycling factor
MRKFRLVITVCVMMAALGLVLWLGVVIMRSVGIGGGQKFYNTATVLQQVQSLSQLVTVKYVMEKVVVLEDVKWFGENRVLLVAHGIVKAGVDFQQMKPGDIHVSGKKISIRLPLPQITDAYLDDKQTRVVERTTGLLRVFDKDMEQTARQNAVDDIRRSARTAGILKDAEDRAQAQVKNLFRQMGFQEIEILSH